MPNSKPVTIVLQPGQELRIIAADRSCTGTTSGQTGTHPGDSPDTDWDRPSPSTSPDYDRPSPSTSPDWDSPSPCAGP